MSPIDESTGDDFFNLTISDDNIVHISNLRVAHNFDESTGFAEQLDQAVTDALSKFNEGEARMLIELPHKEGAISPEAAKTFRRMMSENNTRRTAVYGGAKQYQMVTNALLTLSGSNERIRAFKTKEEALKWLDS